MATPKGEIRNIAPSELTVGLDEDDILFELQRIEKVRSDRIKEYNYVPWTKRWLDNRVGWLVQKYRVLLQNNLI